MAERAREQCIALPRQRVMQEVALHEALHDWGGDAPHGEDGEVRGRDGGAHALAVVEFQPALQEGLVVGREDVEAVSEAAD